MKRSLWLLLLAATVAGCRFAEQKAPPDYAETIKKWQAQRATSLQRDDGWLTLVGLHWLAEGENPFGSEKTNKIVLPASAPPIAGNLILQRGKIMLEPNASVGMTIEGKPLNAPVELLPDSAEKGPTVATLGTMKFQVIERAGRFGLRVKDSQSAARAQFAGLQYFDIDPKWRVQAKLEPFDPPREVSIMNVLGFTTTEKVPGELVFEIDGKEYRLQPLLEQGSKDLFIIFKDETSGKETYGAARYLYAPMPGADGRTVIDFNKAYNPPCTFTPFATCPLPPPQNRLPVRVTAGEKNYTGPHA